MNLIEAWKKAKINQKVYHIIFGSVVKNNSIDTLNHFIYRDMASAGILADDWEIEEAEVFFGEGDIFTTTHGKVMLAQVEPSWTCLILLTGTARGNRLANPIYVENGIRRITKAHLSEMLGGTCNVEEVIKTCEKR